MAFYSSNLRWHWWSELCFAGPS